MVLQQSQKHLTALGVELTFQLGVVQVGGRLTVEPAHDVLEALPCGRETIRSRRGRGADPRAPRGGHAAGTAAGALLRPASPAFSGAALASWKRANAAATSATSASVSVRVLVRPPSV